MAQQKVPAAGFAFYLEQVMAARQAAAQQAAREAEQKAANSESVNTQNRPLRIAVPKGSLKEGSVEVLKNAGLDVDGLLDSGRTLMLRNGDVEYIIVRPTDAPVFVALGAADCGICGEDSLLEAAPDVVELVDLKFGGCRFVVAESKGTTEAGGGTLSQTGLDSRRYQIPQYYSFVLRQNWYAGRNRKASWQY